MVHMIIYCREGRGKHINPGEPPIESQASDSTLLPSKLSEAQRRRLGTAKYTSSSMLGQQLLSKGLYVHNW